MNRTVKNFEVGEYAEYIHDYMRGTCPDKYSQLHISEKVAYAFISGVEKVFSFNSFCYEGGIPEGAFGLTDAFLNSLTKSERAQIFNNSVSDI